MGNEYNDFQVGQWLPDQRILSSQSFIEFLGEQDGELERELKQELVPILEEAREVRAAYLAIADYHDLRWPLIEFVYRS